MDDPADLLQAYDSQLRTELHSARRVQQLGPLVLGEYADGLGLITYRSLAEPGGRVSAEEVTGLVAAALAHYLALPHIARVEWKTREHDHAPGLHEALVAHGFVRGTPESIMIGEARLLAVDVELPPQVQVRKVATEADVRRMSALQAEVFEEDEASAAAIMEDMVANFLAGRAGELWLAEVDGRVVSAGRLDPVPGTRFAGIWGGSTHPDFRGRGIYRALTAGRARAAISLGKRYIYSESTEFSRPILERAGLVKVGITTPYDWTRPAG